LPVLLWLLAAVVRVRKYQIIQYAICVRASLSEGRPGNNKINSRINLIDGNRSYIFRKMTIGCFANFLSLKLTA